MPIGVVETEKLFLSLKTVLVRGNANLPISLNVHPLI